MIRNIFVLLTFTYCSEALKCIICGDKNVRGRKWECFEALSVITRNSNNSVVRDFSGHNQHLIEGARNYDGAEDELLIDCQGWCEAEFRRGDDVPATMRCVQGDPTQEKVTWSPYALINKVKNIWCQWPAFGLADVRCVCKNEDKCNNLEKPGRSNRRNSGYRLEAGPLLVLTALASLLR